MRTAKECKGGRENEGGGGRGGGGGKSIRAPEARATNKARGFSSIESNTR